ncbi:hypothetical protein HNP70_001099 [Borreliella kurtenbachii]
MQKNVYCFIIFVLISSYNNYANDKSLKRVKEYLEKEAKVFLCLSNFVL